VIFGARDVAEPDLGARNIGISLTERKVVAWLRELPGTDILTARWSSSSACSGWARDNPFCLQSKSTSLNDFMSGLERGMPAAPSLSTKSRPARKCAGGRRNPSDSCLTRQWPARCELWIRRSADKFILQAQWRNTPRASLRGGTISTESNSIFVCKTLLLFILTRLGALYNSVGR
jgi:hypothetical protein